jgi:hypothetical protein
MKNSVKVEKPRPSQVYFVMGCSATDMMSFNETCAFLFNVYINRISNNQSNCDKFFVNLSFPVFHHFNDTTSIDAKIISISAAIKAAVFFWRKEI